jgi:hypothetical protein
MKKTAAFIWLLHPAPSGSNMKSSFASVAGSNVSSLMPTTGSGTMKHERDVRKRV